MGGARGAGGHCYRAQPCCWQPPAAATGLLTLWVSHRQNDPGASWWSSWSPSRMRTPRSAARRGTCSGPPSGGAWARCCPLRGAVGPLLPSEAAFEDLTAVLSGAGGRPDGGRTDPENAARAALAALRSPLGDVGGGGGAACACGTCRPTWWPSWHTAHMPRGCGSWSRRCAWARPASPRPQSSRWWPAALCAWSALATCSWGGCLGPRSLAQAHGPAHR